MPSGIRLDTAAFRALCGGNVRVLVGPGRLSDHHWSGCAVTPAAGECGTEGHLFVSVSRRSTVRARLDEVAPHLMRARRPNRAPGVARFKWFSGNWRPTA